MSTHGGVALLQIFVLPRNHTYIVDVFTLGHTAFHNAGHNGLTLKALLESSSIPKVFFDARNDAHALYHQQGVKLAGVLDIQVWEMATKIRRTHIVGLANCVKKDAPMTPAENRAWQKIKENGIKAFAPEKGGTHEVFHQRPLALHLLRYCAQDVEVLPGLLAIYRSKLDYDWVAEVHEKTMHRIESAQHPDFNGAGPHMLAGPWL